MHVSSVHARKIVALRVSELGFMAYVGENFPTRIGISDSFEFVRTFGCFLIAINIFCQLLR